MKRKSFLIALLGAAMVCSACGETPSKKTTTGGEPTSVVPTSGDPTSLPPSTAELTSISVSGTHKTSFFVNEAFTYDGLVVTAHYSDQSSHAVTGFTVTPPSMTTAGQRDVYVSYSENNIIKETTYQITIVSIAVTSITLSGTYLTTFNVGDTFNHDGLVVTAHFNNGSQQVVTEYQISNPNMSSAGQKEVTVSYGGKSESYFITVNGDDPSEVQTARDAALAAVNAAFNELDISEYSNVRWNKIVNKLNSTIEAINTSGSVTQINSLRDDAITYFENSPTATEVREGTWFDYGSADGKYTFDRDDDNNLVVMYDTYPGHWVYIGTKTNLNGDINEYNQLSVTFRNDFDQDIQVCLQATDSGGSYKVDSHTTNVAGLETKTITLDFDLSVTRLYFFVDSCSEHTHAGQITILDTNLSFVDRPFEKNPKTVNITDGTFSTGDKGNSIYTLTAEDDPALIEYVSATIQVDFHGNGNSKRWFGLHLYTGTVHESFSDSQVHTRDISDGEYAIYTKPISSTKILKTDDEIALDVSYLAEGLTFKVLSYTFIYGQFKETTTETVSVNKNIYENANVTYSTTYNTRAEFLAADTSDLEDGYTVRVKNDDPYGASIGFYSWNGAEWERVGAAEHVKIPYSSFTKKGAVKKVEIEFETVNTASYTKSQVYFQNLNFATFPGSGNNNVLNISPIMDKSSDTPKTGTMTIYPLSKVDLNEDIAFEIDCWWSSADRITIKSITLTTEFIGSPSPVEELEAHPTDGGMVLTWASAAHAQEYDVYINGSKHSTTKLTSSIIDGLTNDTEYTFGVVAKNATGESDMVTVKGTPAEGASYDTFIEALNTPLEEYLGNDKIAAAFNQGNHYITNSTYTNNRIKGVVDKMKAGQETTVAFMGGSITVGETAKLRDENNHAKGYAYYTYQWLKNNYDVQNKSHFVNGSISGTGSEIGIVRAQKDILDHNPDLVFIEFAANNGSTDFYKQSYESLIRKVLNLPNNPAIVLVFSCTTYTNNGSEDRYMKQIGEYYRLPMVSVDKALRAVFSNITKEDAEFKKFSDDGTHPNDEGHQLMAKIICNYLREIIKKRTMDDYAKPANPSQNGYDRYENMISVDHNTNKSVVTSLGSFAEGNTGTPATRDQSDVTAFQQGWIKSAGAENDAMTIKVNAKNFVLIYCAGNQAGGNTPRGNIVVSYVNDADPSDNGELTWNLAKTCKQNDSSDMDTITESGNGWDNPCGIQIFSKESAADYTISITVAGNSSVTAEEAICWIMAFGYTA